MKAKVKFTLEETLANAKITKNGIAVQGRVRPATVADLCNGDSKSISFKTLLSIVDALNELDKSKLRKYEMHDILKVEYDE